MRYDLAVIGAGVTGLAAAMYAGRLNLRTIVLGNAGERSAALDIGGTITLTDVVENYPGFVKLTGQELAQKMEEHARDYPQVAIKNAWVKSIDRQEDCFVVHTGEEVVQATTLLFATGTGTGSSTCRAMTSSATRACSTAPSATGRFTRRRW
jgi:thioredoxin reductase (NADPH)